MQSQNPYQSPDAREAAADSARRRLFVCPVCQQQSVTAFRAWMHYPQFRIRCPACKAKLRLRLERRGWWKYWISSSTATSVALFYLYGVFAWAPVENTDRLLKYLFPGWWAEIYRVRGLGGTAIVAGMVVLAVFFLSVAPLIVMAVGTIRTVADFGSLESVGKKS